MIRHIDRRSLIGGGIAASVAMLGAGLLPRAAAAQTTDSIMKKGRSLSAFRATTRRGVS